MNRKKRLLPLLMALLLIVSYLPVMRSYAAGTYTVKIDESHGACEASDGTFTYKDGTSVMGTMKIVSSDSKGFQQSSKLIEEVQENTVFTITVTPSEGYQVTLRLNGNTVPLTGGEGRTMTGTITATGTDQTWVLKRNSPEAGVKAPVVIQIREGHRHQVPLRYSSRVMHFLEVQMTSTTN